MSDIEARAGTPGALYQTKSGHRVRVLRIEAEQVILEPADQPGKEIPVPSYYVLIPVAEEAAAPAQAAEQLGPDGQPRMQVTVEELVMQPRAIIAPAIPRLSTPDLERLSELDTRMFVIDLIGKELRSRAEAQPQAALVAPVRHPELEPHPIVPPEAMAAAAPSEAPAKPRRVWIMLLRDEMLIEVPGRRPALRIPYEGEGAPVAWYGFRAATPPEGYTGPEPGEESAEDVGVRMLTGALRVALGAEDTADPPIDGWEIRSTMALAISEARLATCEGNTPRRLSSSRDQAAFVKDVASLTGLAWMLRGSVQPTTRREIERQVKALESLEACATMGELARWAEDKRAKPLERPGVARRYAYVSAHLKAIEEAVPFLAWCQEEGFSFDIDGEEQDVGLWLDGLGEETPERIRAAGAAAKAVKDRQLADRQEREAPPVAAPHPTPPPVDEDEDPRLCALQRRVEDFVGRGPIPDWLTRETFSERCFARVVGLVDDERRAEEVGRAIDATRDLKILETAHAFLLHDDATAPSVADERASWIWDRILALRPPAPPPVNLAGAGLREQLASCAAARALELLATAEHPRDQDAVADAMEAAENPRVRQACRDWLDRHGTAPRQPSDYPEARQWGAVAAERGESNVPPGYADPAARAAWVDGWESANREQEAALLAELQARAVVALGQFSTWNIEVSHKRAPFAGEPSWCVIARTPTGLRRAGHGETLEGAAADLRLLLEQEFPSPTPPPPSAAVAEKDEAPDPTAEPIVLERVILITLPSGQEDVWYDSPSLGKVLMGEARRPDLRAIAGAARKRDAQAAIAARQQDATRMTAAAVTAAQQTLTSLAVGLPAFVQLGIEVEIRITTRRPDPVGAQS